LTYAKRKARPTRAPAPAVILLRVIAEAAPVGVDDEVAVVWETVTVAKVADEEAAAVVVVALLLLDEALLEEEAVEDAAVEASVLLAAAEVVSAELSEEDAPASTVKSPLLARTPAESMIWIS
jgi:hypothetical protein